MFKPSKTVLSVGVGAVALGILTLTFPKAAHALAATLVQVTNTPANPVPNKDVDQQGRNFYQARQTCDPGPYCSLYFPSVPTGQRLIIQHVSARLAEPNTTSAQDVELHSLHDVTSQYLPVTLLPGQVGNFSEYACNEQVLASFDAGDTPFISFGALSGSAVISGYTISYP